MTDIMANTNQATGFEVLAGCAVKRIDKSEKALTFWVESSFYFFFYFLLLKLAYLILIQIHLLPVDSLK